MSKSREIGYTRAGRLFAQLLSMTKYLDAERRQAFVELLARADATDTLRRHRHVFDGCPDRHAQLPMLAAAYVQAKLLEWRERDELCEAAEAAGAVAVQRSPETARSGWRDGISQWAPRQVA